MLMRQKAPWLTLATTGFNTEVINFSRGREMRAASAWLGLDTQG